LRILDKDPLTIAYLLRWRLISRVSGLVWITLPLTQP